MKSKPTADLPNIRIAYHTINITLSFVCGLLFIIPEFNIPPENKLKGLLYLGIVGSFMAWFMYSLLAFGKECYALHIKKPNITVARFIYLSLLLLTTVAFICFAYFATLTNLNNSDVPGIIRLMSLVGIVLLVSNIVKKINKETGVVTDDES